ncbi:glycosyl hydrolase [Parabacteroides sp. AM08-6]|uniref:glycosyl hydrolase n=1 Tax=Parabacteroides sp. AM08-6 TaxID=2292053 RepID=UPI000EFEC79F|nr:glycosyl hydrolase [Parabacteroides sp. AM08-6]RHJ82558.1 hypothetical protein DW103_09420 [Parabacteroides sp. AM08-6]
MKHVIFSLLLICIVTCNQVLEAQVPITPSKDELYCPFNDSDINKFKTPGKVFYPETWFHYIGGNVSIKGITTDLEAIANAGFAGIHLFHGQFGGPWPGVDPQIACLSPMWDDMVKHTAQECRRLGLRFTMQNCPGWAMSGGPWIEPSNAMRHLVWSRTDITGGSEISKSLPTPQPSNEDWRDYNDLMVIAFPTPMDDDEQPLKPVSFKSNKEGENWENYLLGKSDKSMHLSPATDKNPNWLEVEFPQEVTIRTLEFPSINEASHPWCFEPGIRVKVEAYLANGTIQEILNTDLPQSDWQENYPISLACSETKGAKKYKISIINQHDISLRSLRLFTASRKNNWEAEAGWLLRSIERSGDSRQRAPETFLKSAQMMDITASMDKQGNLKWKAPKGKWTVLRIGHVNTGQRNSPAPPEGTGWECNKLSTEGSNAHFAGYIGRLSGKNGPLANGLLKGMLMDSWECRTQTWTAGLDKEFEQMTGYPLQKWLPAIFGYVVDDEESTFRFLCDWRMVINKLFAYNFYGNMAKLAKENGLSITYETAAGDVFPADILEYFKFADVPMCEFWQPLMENFVGSLNFKPIKPTTSAARIYGKPRIAAEAFTSFNHTWDEHWQMLKEVANINCIEGVTHLVFHTYTHNPQVGFLQPGTSFSGAGIGTPFLRGQTWWKYMPEFTTYLARCSYLQERGIPVSDVLWYLGDEINHKPDQKAPFPEGFKYDYCNPDVLLNRLTVDNGDLVTPEGLRYRVLWLPEVPRMRPETIEKLQALIQEGATVIGEAPFGLATLSGGKSAQKRFDKAVKSIWGNTSKTGIRQVGKGRIVSGISLAEALKQLNIEPDVKGSKALWLHRKTNNADWYFVTVPQNESFRGELDFRNNGSVEIWDPMTGEVSPAISEKRGDRTSVKIDLPQAGSYFVVFRKDKPENGVKSAMEKKVTGTISLDQPWELKFPAGWGAPASIQISELKPWKELDVSAEAKAFSGTVEYSSTFNVDKLPDAQFILNLGKVDMIAEVILNGKPVQTVWTSPYQVDITKAVQSGENSLTVKVTSTWFNRLVYDAAQPEAERKTWVLRWPDKNEPLRESGLLGPVAITVKK